MSSTLLNSIAEKIRNLTGEEKEILADSLLRERDSLDASSFYDISSVLEDVVKLIESAMSESSIDQDCVKQVLKNSGWYDAKNGLHSYRLEKPDGSLIATVIQKSSDALVDEVQWYGGEKHGKSELIDGGMEKLMNFVGEQS